MSVDSIARLRDAFNRAKTPHILVVEDAEDDINLLTHELSKYPVVLFFVRSAGAAIANLSINTYDLCLLDLGLPDSSDPLMLVELIKERSPYLPIVVLTGGLSEDLRMVLSKRVLAVLLKPLTTERLRDVLAL